MVNVETGRVWDEAKIPPRVDWPPDVTWSPNSQWVALRLPWSEAGALIVSVNQPEQRWRLSHVVFETMQWQPAGP